MKKILLIGAHYDDPDLGCGGVGARLSDEGKEVYKLIITDNHVDESSFNKYTDENTSRLENIKACNILGIKDISDFKKEPNCTLEYSKELMQRIEAVISELEIDTVFMHSEYDLNHDHIKAAEICKVAARHVGNQYVYRSNMYITETSFDPRVFFDISDFIDRKIEALNAYGIEHQRIMANGENRLFDNVIHQNRIWGYCIDRQYAEGFEVIKEVR